MFCVCVSRDASCPQIHHRMQLTAARQHQCMHTGPAPLHTPRNIRFFQIYKLLQITLFLKRGLSDSICQTDFTHEFKKNLIQTQIFLIKFISVQYAAALFKEHSMSFYTEDILRNGYCVQTMKVNKVQCYSDINILQNIFKRLDVWNYIRVNISRNFICGSLSEFSGQSGQRVLLWHLSLKTPDAYVPLLKDTTPLFPVVGVCGKACVL